MPNYLLGKSWNQVLQKELDSDYFKIIGRYLGEIRNKGIKVWPNKEDYFNAFRLTPYNAVKVVFVAQEPYHNAGIADGLTFSSAKKDYCPPSLEQVFNEIEKTVYNGIYIDKNRYNLDRWAIQGVFLLNKYLSVREGLPLSHRNLGWQYLTAAALIALNNHEYPIAFMFFGKEAKGLKSLITNEKHLILEAFHPAHAAYINTTWDSGDAFNKINEFLTLNKQDEIVW